MKGDPIRLFIENVTMVKESSKDHFYFPPFHTGKIHQINDLDLRTEICHIDVHGP